VQIRDWREEALNTLLSAAWDKYVEALGEGRVLELEASYETWVARALNDAQVAPSVADAVG